MGVSRKHGQHLGSGTFSFSDAECCSAMYSCSRWLNSSRALIIPFAMYNQHIWCRDTFRPAIHVLPQQLLCGYVYLVHLERVVSHHGFELPTANNQITLVRGRLQASPVCGRIKARGSKNKQSVAHHQPIQSTQSTQSTRLYIIWRGKAQGSTLHCSTMHHPAQCTTQCNAPPSAVRTCAGHAV